MNGNKHLVSSISSATTKILTPTQVGRIADSIAEHFTQFLAPKVALSEELKEEVFRIRHNVYCEELALEETKVSGQEVDEFDEHSTFALIQHNASKEYTSCIRLVTSTHAKQLLPIEKYCQASITNKDFSPDNFKRDEVAEISRLAVKANFRRRKADEFKGSATGVICNTTYSETEFRCFPFITIGLYMASAAIGINSGINHFYVMMEPRLARSMKFIGINFKQLGPPVNYHGQRAPYYITPEVFRRNLSTDLLSLYKTIERDVCLQLYKSPNN